MSEKSSESLGALQSPEKKSQRNSSEGSPSTSPTLSLSNGDLEQGKKERDDAEFKPFDWDGPNDPHHPHQWPRALKLYIGLVLTVITMIVSINSSIYNTGAEQEVKEFGISAELNILGTSLFLIVRSRVIQQIQKF